MIRKLTPLLFYLVFAILFSASAQNEADSLRSILENQEKDTSKVITHLRLYEVLKLKDPEQALQNLDKSLKLSIDLNYKKGTFKALMSLGDQLTTYSDYDSALALFQKAQTIAAMLNDRKGTMDAMIGQGFSYSSLQRLEDADTIAYSTLEIAGQEPVDSLIMTSCYTILSNTAYFRSLYEKSIEFDQKGLLYNTKDLGKRAKSLLNIGTIHSVLRHRDLSFEYYFKALEEAKKADDDKMKASVYLELGTEYAYIKDFELARKNFTKAMEYFVKVNDKRKIAFINQSLAWIHADLKEFDLALGKYRLALQQVDEINSPYQKAHLHFLLGRTHVQMEGFTDAIKEFEQAQMLFQQIQNSNMARWSAFRLSEIYEIEGNFEKAYRYLQEVKKLDDSTFTATSEKNVAEVEEKYQNEQKQKEIELLNAENEIASLEIQKQEDFRNYLIVAAFLLVVLIGVIYNRYQLKARANTKLTELDHLKTNFFTNISHEFRTPLTLILSPLQKLLKQETSVKKKEALTIIHRNATILTELTNQLLDLSKLEAGELHLKANKGEFSAFIRVVCASFESLASAQNIEFIKHIDDAPKEAYFDEDKVQKILNNLLSNAFKFTSKEGKVTIQVTLVEDKLAISVQDTGQGISPEDQQLIFKRFHQNRTNTPNAAGTGVGLTLSKELALLHKGDITVESEPGQGATFTLEFPINKSAYLPK
ncbi:MAG: ATP-binding protein, partial [Bacteroidota bacterium]